MEFHHPLGSSSYNSHWALFMSSREWQKTNVTAPSSCPLSLFCLLLVPFGSSLLTWAGLCASYKMDINNTCLLWAFIPHGLSLVDTFVFFHRYLQWAFRQLVVIFETIGQASKCSCKFHIANNAHGF